MNISLLWVKYLMNGAFLHQHLIEMSWATHFSEMPNSLKYSQGDFLECCVNCKLAGFF